MTIICNNGDPMILRIANVLDSATLTSVIAVATDSRFEDGSKTAGWSAREVKKNQQLLSGTVSRMVDAALRRNDVFMAAAQPKTFCRIMLNRYEPGMFYGPHVDNALINGMRADISFTLFLSAADSYDGGELVLQGLDGETSVKLGQGDLVLYPTCSLHRVAEVRSGTRLACVGWVRSLVRLAMHREILFDLESVANSIYAREGKTDLFDRLSGVKANLTRLWAED